MMRTFIIAFFCGILILLPFHTLPTIPVLAVCMVIAVVLFFIALRRIIVLRIYFICIAAALTGFCYASLRGHFIHAHQLAHAYEGKPIQLIGTITSIPHQLGERSYFLFKVAKINHQAQHMLLKLSSTDEASYLHPGDTWQVTARLKRIHSFFNPGGGDYEAWTFMQGIGGQANVLARPDNALLAHHAYDAPIALSREYLLQKLLPYLNLATPDKWIPALAVGERADISVKDWQVLRNTGTNHLMAIAGLHIGFITALIFFLFENIWRLSARLCHLRPARDVATLAALLMGISYALLSGFSLPAQRACIMLTVFLLATLLRRRLPGGHVYCLALFFVLLWQPFSVLGESFWLSFGAVALILYGISGRLAPRGLWWKFGRLQWVTALGLLPVTIALFQQYSLISFFANGISIPWMGFIILPLLLASLIFLCIYPPLGKLFLWLVQQNLHGLWKVLSCLAHLPLAALPITAPTPWPLLAAMIGVIFLLAPRGFPYRILGFIWLLPLVCIFFYPPATPPLGRVALTLLDVGQGLSAVIETQQHTLVFDAGARFHENDMGERVVRPFLAVRGKKKIDMLVVSHGDNDHAGGVATLLKSFSIDKVVAGEPARLARMNVLPCQPVQWQWDNVQFNFLYPDKENINLGNDSSCVLKVTAANGQSVLLTGDIEKKAEKKLLQHSRVLSSTILIAPHHGSKTSADAKFVAAVKPRWVLFPLGYRNRYHFPHPTVVARYRQIGATLLASDQCGAIQVMLGAVPLQLDCYRQTHGHFWND